ncbi:MAG: hypothetical protein EZS28_036191 [Streblomastix strix]|uniref:Uncharacterized protein n=1 Tax=Streblomastix strix TaxID=222440 RepID=A0A5J4UEB7_9EUKA|nr:MAG: hypothetical protein EZS28_036191 [Streblomastix strix]
MSHSTRSAESIASLNPGKKAEIYQWRRCSGRSQRIHLDKVGSLRLLEANLDQIALFPQGYSLKHDGKLV